MANYSNTRAVNGLTGDLVVASGASDFTFAEPAAQIVLIVLRTMKGMCRANPLLGVEWNKVTDRASAIRAMEAGLAPWVQRGRLANVVCDAQDVGNGQFRVQVDFEDPRRPGKDQKPVITVVP